MKSQVVVALVVLVTVAAHIALYRWVRFKIHEGVVLKFLRDEQGGGASRFHQVDVIAAHTQIPAARVAAVCQKSADMQPDPQVENSWRAD